MTTFEVLISRTEGNLLNQSLKNLLPSPELSSPYILTANEKLKKKKEKGEELINIFMKQKKSEKKAHKKLKKSFVVAILSPSLNKARKKSKAH